MFLKIAGSLGVVFFVLPKAVREATTVSGACNAIWNSLAADSSTSVMIGMILVCLHVCIKVAPIVAQTETITYGALWVNTGKILS